MVAQSKCFIEDRPGNNNVESNVEVGPRSLGWADLHYAISHISLSLELPLSMWVKQELDPQNCGKNI